MKAIFLGYNPPDSDLRWPREGFTIGKTYAIELHRESAEVIDDDGVWRSRPLHDFDVQSGVRRAWARFPSLRAVFA